MAGLTELSQLSLPNNNLDGEIPPELSNLSNLTKLNLSHNRLSGAIPTELGRMGLLESLNLSTNQLRGSIPGELGDLTSLTNLRLLDNKLSGAIPAALGDLANLRRLLLSRNQLSGPIPGRLGNLSKLQTLSIEDNQLTGAIPTELGRLTELSELRLSRNQLTGAIPTELGNLAKLELLYLSRNRLSGDVPSQLGNLSELEGLNLHSNQLTGCVPEHLEDQLDRTTLWSVGVPFCTTSTRPGAPTGVTATADGRTEIDLSWSAPSDNGGANITGYRIEVSTNGSSWSDLVADTNSTRTSYSHTGLTEGSSWHYRVSAINSEGTGPASGTDSATTEEASNSAPQAVGAIPDQIIIPGTELIVDVSPYFSDPEDDALSYSIWSRQLFSQESVSGSTVTLLLSTSAIFCDPRTVTVTAQDPAGLQATQEFTLRRVNNPPVASTGPFPSQTIEVGETVRLSMSNWFSDTDRCDGSLMYSAESSDTGKATASASGNTVSVEGKAAGKAIITVTAEDGEGLTATLDIQVTVAAAAATKPGKPTGLTATADGQTEIELSWTAPSEDGGAEITGYRIEVSTDGSSWSDLVADTDSTSTSYPHTGLTAGSTRHYRVSAINSEGTGAASNTDSATTDAAPAPAPPNSPGNARYSRDGSTIVVSWDAVSEATHYKVYYSDFFDSSCSISLGRPTFCEELAANVTGTTYTHADPDDGKSYYWITACNTGGCSDIDTRNPAQFIDNRPSAPANVGVSRESSSLKVSWNAVSSATHYKVYYSDFFDSNCQLTFGRPFFCEELAADVSGPAYTHAGQSILSPKSPSIKVVDRTSDSLTVKWFDRNEINYYWVTACNSAGCSDIANSSSASFRLGAQYYQLSRSLSREGEYSLLESRLTGSSLVDQDLQPSTVYYYRIVGCNDDGCSDPSRTGGLTESDGDVDIPPIPTGVEGKKVKLRFFPDNARISWDTVAGATYYKVYQGSQFETEVSAPQVSYYDASPNRFLGGFSSTSYKVQACNKAGCSPSSESVTVS